MVLAGIYIPNQFSGVKKCKWMNCDEIFEDAVEAFKHIRDSHLKLQKQISNAGDNRRKRKGSTLASNIPSEKKTPRIN